MRSDIIYYDCYLGTSAKHGRQRVSSFLTSGFPDSKVYSNIIHTRCLSKKGNEKYYIIIKNKFHATTNLIQYELGNFAIFDTLKTVDKAKSILRSKQYSTTNY